MSPHAVTAHAHVIDHIAKPTFVFDADRRIHACNRAGKEMLATPLSPINVVSGVLYGVDTAVDKAIAFQSFAVNQWPQLVLSDQFSPVSKAMRIHWIAVSVSCLQTARRDDNVQQMRYLLLTVHPVLVHCDVDPALLQAALGLSRSEARISALIYAGLGLREVALKMGIGQSTVKTHLQGVFSKVNISKQTELVKLVASLA
jgi:DNA-binding CsgD family transcriptional regulator